MKKCSISQAIREMETKTINFTHLHFAIPRKLYSVAQDMDKYPSQVIKVQNTIFTLTFRIVDYHAIRQKRLIAAEPDTNVSILHVFSISPAILQSIYCYLSYITKAQRKKGFKLHTGGMAAQGFKPRVVLELPLYAGRLSADACPAFISLPLGIGF